MRIPAFLAVLAFASPAGADDSIAGTYDVKLQETATTCDPKPEVLSSTKLALTVKKATVTAKLDKLFPMTGTLDDGTITAKTTKLIGTAMAGLSARYSITGHANAGVIELVLTAHYIRQDTNKPHCTQAWSVTGKKAN